MNRFFIVASAIALASCSRKTTPPITVTQPAPAFPSITQMTTQMINDTLSAVKSEAREVQTKAPPVAINPPKLHTKSIGNIDISYVYFDSRSHKLRVVDQAKGPGTEFTTAKEACESIQGIAATNAGFFTPDGSALGVVVTNGKKRGANNSSSLGVGYYVDNGASKIVRRQAFSGNAKEALQTGPFLIENGKAINGLSKEGTSYRSIILWDGGVNWAIAQTTPITLHNLSQTLKGQSFAGHPIKYALNLDGGRSCDLYVSGTVAGGPTQERTLFAKPVRNFLVLTKR